MNEVIVRTSYRVAIAILIVFGGTALPALAQPPARQPLDVVMVLDNSGSMRKNDSEALMSKAVSAFAAKLSANSQMGVVIFDQSVRVPLTLTSAGTQDFSARVAQSLRGIDYRGQWTDIPGGVERALYELREHGRPDATRALVLFTDGMVETGNAAKDAERTRWLQESLAAEARERGIRIFGVAFTEGADFQLMQSLAQATGGEHYRVLAPADIAGTFASILSRLDELNRATTAPPEDHHAAAGTSAPASTPVKAAETPNEWRRWVWIAAATLAILAAALVVRLTSSRAIPAARLRDLGGYSGRSELELTRRLTWIGRNPQGNDIVLAREEVSSRHAAIEFRNGMFYLRDLRSSNGTFVNGRQISNPQEVREVPLKHRDRIRFDACEFEFSVDGEASVGGTVLSPSAGAARTGTRLRPKEAAADAAAAPAAAKGLPPQAAKVAGADAGTIIKTGFCYQHASHSAIAACGKCSRELCADCLQHVNGLPLCPVCRPAVA